MNPTDQSPTKTFFNSTKLDGAELIESIERAGYQNGRVLEIFKGHQPGDTLTPRAVFREYKKHHGPGSIELTSVRRAMNTLTRLGILTKKSERIIQDNGFKSYGWVLNP